jgi:hypothetical protein
VSGYRSDALHHFANAKTLLSHDRSNADAEARSAIDSVVRAFWWAEDTGMEEKQHLLMHKIGRWTRRNLGCQLHFDGAKYSHRCPIRIAHKRIGLSPGYVGQCICSICGADLSECEHIVGRSYWVRGGPVADGPCRVCFKTNCGHKSDRLYRASVVKIIREAELREASFVSRPANPEARLLELPVDSPKLVTALSPGFEMGMRVSCDKCLDQCWGFDELPLDGGA